MEGSYSPGTTENVTEDIPDLGSYKFQAIYGDEASFGGGYTLPWEEGRSSAVLGFKINAIRAGKWTYEDYNLGAFYDRQVMQPYIRNQSGLNLYEDDQLEVYAEINQDVRLMTLTGKLQFINRSDGYTLGLAGGFVY